MNYKEKKAFATRYERCLALVMSIRFLTSREWDEHGLMKTVLRLAEFDRSDFPWQHSVVAAMDEIRKSLVGPFVFSDGLHIFYVPQDGEWRQLLGEAYVCWDEKEYRSNFYRDVALSTDKYSEEERMRFADWLNENKDSWANEVVALTDAEVEEKKAKDQKAREEYLAKRKEEGL